MYDIIEAKMKGVQQDLYLSYAVSTASSSSEAVELGDEPTQLRNIEYATEACLHRVQQEKEQAIEALKQEKEEFPEQLRVAQQEKDDMRAKFEEDREQIQREKYHLLVVHTTVKVTVAREIFSVPGLAQMEEEITESQVGNLTEAIQELQERVAEL
jgi:hypothetical protein